MKRFVFRLARVERLRASEKREARAGLVLAVAEALDRQRDREALEESLVEAAGALLPATLPSEPAALRAIAARREGLRAAAHAAALVEVDAFDRALEAEREFARASRAHRVLERLHERKRQRHDDEAAHEAQRFLDEIHLLRLSPRGGGRKTEED